MAVAVGLAMMGGIATAVTASADDQKAWVCKYVGTPYVNETLKNGNDGLVWVDTGTTQGSYFGDSQNDSYVLLVGPHETKPDASGCPAPRIVTPPVFTPPTCDSPGSVLATDTNYYTWTHAGPLTAVVYTAKHGDVVLFVSDPYNLVQLTGEQCEEPTEVTPEASATQGTCDAAGQVTLGTNTGYSWSENTGTENDPIYTATAIEGYKLIGTGVFTFNGLSQLLSQSTNSELPCYIAPLAPDTPAISVVKTATLHDTINAANTAGKADAGETITYSFLVTNTGNVTLTGVAVVDPKLDSVPGSAVTCAPTTLLPGDTVTCTAAAYIVKAADVAAGKPIINVATASGQPPTGSRVTATSTVSTPSQEPAVVAGIVADAPVVAGIVADAPVVKGVVKNAPAVKSLAFTGAETLPLGLSGLLALVLGAVLTVASRRQRPKQARE